MFPVIQISDDAEILEQLGTKKKFWYRQGRFLFKEGRAGTGENWAEVVAATIAAQLGLPHATYELAQSGESKGVSTPNFVPRDGRLVLGNELINPTGVSAGAKPSRDDRRGAYVVRRVHALLGLSAVKTPYNWSKPAQVNGAAGVMAGYLLLDALIGNQDRHEENWGLVVLPRSPSAEGGLYLAPTFDHASSLGRNESDVARQAKLNASDPRHSVEGFARRAVSQFYDADGRRMRTLDAFLEFARLEHSSAEYWVAQLSRMGEVSFRLFLDRVPADWISEPAREFAVQMLQVNRRRLLESNL